MRVYVWVIAHHGMHVDLHLVVGGVERMHGACVRLLLLLLSGTYYVLPHRYCCLVSDTVPCHWHRHQPGHVFPALLGHDCCCLI